MACSSHPSRAAVPAITSGRRLVRGAAKALGDFRLWSLQHLIVAEALYVTDLETVDEPPVETSEVVGALLEGGGMGLLEIAGHWAREVDGVLLPVARSRRVKTKFGRRP
jgi:hypothetical protein